MKKPFFTAFIACAAAAGIVFGLSLFLPSLMSSDYYEKSLKHLRRKAESIKKESAQIIETFNRQQRHLLTSPPPAEPEELFSLFKKMDLDPDLEGISAYDAEGHLLLWYGNVIDLEMFAFREGENILGKNPRASLLIRDKASFYLIRIRRAQDGRTFVFSRLLAFLPRFKTPYLKEYHFLGSKLLRNGHIEYWDFREDVAVLERIFSRHKDEYVGEPGLQGELQTIFFPLRNEAGKIIATVNLNSPTLSSRLSSQKERMLLLFYLFIALALVSLLVHLLKSAPSTKGSLRRFLPFLIILLLAGLRMLFFPLSQLESVRSFSLFSPSTSSFFSLWDFTKSPADIFLTSFFLFLIVGCALMFVRTSAKEKKPRFSKALSAASATLAIGLTWALLLLFFKAVERLVTHSNINLLRVALDAPLVFLHASVFLLLFAVLMAGYSLLRLAFSRAFSLAYILGPVVFVIGAFGWLASSSAGPVFAVLSGIMMALLLVGAWNPSLFQKKEILFSGFVLIVLLLYPVIQLSFSERNRVLLENYLQNTVRHQKTWARFLIRESLPELDKRADAISAFFHNPTPSSLAQTLWEETQMARFNWYSSLELVSPEGDVLSRFSLNIPEMFEEEYELPLSPEWTIARQSLLFMDIRKEFLVGYRDWLEGTTHLGRVMVYLLVDYDMLPFLYSANPYFELLRSTSIPSLDQVDFGFAVFNLKGELLFNPDKITWGMSAEILQRARSSPSAFWSGFVDKGKSFQSLFFREGQNIYAFFVPDKTLLDHIVDILKIFFLYLIFFVMFVLVVSLATNRKSIRSPFWSFSNRVYISFVVVAVIPLLLFTFSTRSFFRRMFTEQITEKAEIHAHLARRVVEDFISLQQEEQVSLTLPPDNVMLLISSTINNDVHLYQDGRLISSSRRDFFDYGILPELVDGEVYYGMRYENHPFFPQTQRIGNYAFHVLTIPYVFRDSLLLISLPFPLEQQELSRATRELFEFLFLISSFFVFLVLLFARGIGGMIVTPINKLLSGTREVSLGNLEVSLSHTHEDEMKTLIDGFNTMVKNLKKHQQELADMGQKVAWAELARKAAHEIKNPLTPIQLSAEHLLQVYKDRPEDFEKALQESTSYIIKEVDNLRKIARDFLEISRETSMKMERFDIREAVQETTAPYKNLLAGRILIEETYQGDEFPILGDKNKLKIALRNVLTNAVEAIEETGRIKIAVSCIGPAYRVEVQDTGQGMGPETLSRIFDPYFSTKEGGTGLGLSIARKIIEDHNGKIEVSSQEKVGTKITLLLPRPESGKIQGSPD